MGGTGGPYASKSEVLGFLQKIKSDLTLADITDLVYFPPVQIINQRTDTHWEIFNGTILMDGHGENYILIPIVPIVTITEILIEKIDETTESLDLAGTDRQVWWNTDTGVLTRINPNNIDITRGRGFFDGPLFPRGQQNIAVTGTFGRDVGHDAEDILKLLHILLVMKIMNFQFPSKFRAVDLVQERIGEYEYRIGDMQYSRLDSNQKLTLDGYINMLFDTLPKDDQYTVEAV